MPTPRFVGCLAVLSSACLTAPQIGQTGSDGAAVAEASAEASWAVAEVVAPPPACCLGDQECLGAERCIEGRCMSPLPGGACWDDLACDPCWGPDVDCDGVPGSFCKGGFVCPCDVDCGFPGDIQGSCSPYGPGTCCQLDGECGPGMVCAGPEAAAFADPPVRDQYWCVSPAGPGACYRDAECGAGQTCVGAFLPSCLTMAPPAPGVCTPAAPPGCCAQEADCPFSAARCAKSGPGDDFGVCKPLPTYDHCWDDLDCSAAQTCANAFWCPCGMECGRAETLGTCQGSNQGCCTKTGLCPLGAVCHEGPQICWPAPAPGHCFTAAECGAGQVCVGAASCPCGNDCDMDYEGAGVCATPVDADCMALDPALVDEVCDAASRVVFDGKACVATCLGCCGTPPAKQASFQDMAACEAACGK